jgi:hypothetical protein
VKRVKAFRDSVAGLDIETYLRRVKDSGWLEGRNERAADALEQRIRDSFAKNPASAFYALADTSFDAECIESSGPNEECSYHSVLMQLAEHSRGLFRPEELSDEVDHDEGTARLAFELEGEIFEREFAQNEDWFSNEALELVNEALEASGRDERFLALPASDQVMHLALVSQEVFDRAVDLGAIVDSDFYPIDDDLSVDD